MILETVEHPVDDDSGDGDVEPDWQCPTGDSPVPLEPSPESPDQGDQGQRDNGSDQYWVGDQDREVERANPTSTFKRDGADLIVIGEIRDQKKS